MALTKRHVPHPDDLHLPEKEQRLVTQYVVPDGLPEPVELLATGDGTGPIRLADGTVYDVTEAWIHVESREHAHELHNLIGEQVKASGQRDQHEPGVDVTWEHVPVKITKKRGH